MSVVYRDIPPEGLGRKEFEVLLKDEDGRTLRRLTRSLSVIPEGRLARRGSGE